jgi:diamine N-acetyltransferase
MPETTAAVRLLPVDKDNWRALTRLGLAEEQKNWVAPTWYTIIQSQFEGGELKAIYADDTPVGLAWYLLEEDKRRAYIIRLMTGLEHQGKGYGRVAMQHIIEDCKTRPFVDDIFISFVPGNDVARNLYLSLGFIDTGEMDEGEHVFKYPVRQQVDE